MKGFGMCWNLAIFQLLLLISLTLSYSSEARNVKHLNPSAVIVGKVYCDTCFQDDFSRSSHFISGATVSVECKDAAFKTEAKTDQQGKFKVHLPLSISKHEKQIEDCQVRLIKSNDPYCAVASTATSSSIHLKSRKQGIRIFSAGFFTFKPLKQPELCNQQPRSTKINTQMNLLDPPKQTKAITRKGLESSKDSIARPQFLLPPLLPPLFPTPPPAIGGIPLPPNPLQPPPLIPLPPNPLQPPSPPFGLPGIPGLPGLTPSLPPPSPLLPIPPGLPIPPVVPGLPGIPGLPGLTPSPPPPSPLLPIPPGLPIPPVVPGVPGLPIPPGLPVPPVVPGVPTLPIPPVPSLPIPPVVPGVPGLPLPPGLPIPPVIPGVPPAKNVSP